MKVEAVQSNDRRQSCLVPMSKGALLGAACGWASKYILPVQPDEKQTPEYRKVIGKIDTQKTEYNLRTKEFINSLKSQQKRSTAQDEFIKMFDGLKEGDHVKIGSIRTAIKNLQEKAPFQVNEFKQMCKDTSAVAEKTAKQCISAYNLVTKHIRPTGFFIVAGAVLGAVSALINDICKTEIKS